MMEMMLMLATIALVFGGATVLVALAAGGVLKLGRALKHRDAKA